MKIHLLSLIFLLIITYNTYCGSNDCNHYYYFKKIHQKIKKINYFLKK